MTDNLGWWFAAQPRLPHGDGREVIIGETHTLPVPPPIVPCKRGFHDCPVAFDTLEFAPGPLLYRVRRGGVVVAQGTKRASSERTYLAMADATRMLREFARSQARQVVHLWDAPAVVREYLDTGDDTLRAAAWAVARDAPWNAAWAATRDATRNAAWAKPWDAAWATARNAAWAAATDATWAAAWAAAKKDFERRCLALIGEAD